jgi:antiviral helicase SKI2
MEDGLVAALDKLQLVNLDEKPDEWIDNILDEQRPVKRVKQDPAELRRELESKYLTPPTKFSTAWLNRLQQYVPCLIIRKPFQLT